MSSTPMIDPSSLYEITTHESFQNHFEYAALDEVKNYVIKKAKGISEQILERFDRCLETNQKKIEFKRVVPLIPDPQIDPTLYTLFAAKKFENFSQQIDSLVEKEWSTIQPSLLKVISQQTADLVKKLIEPEISSKTHAAAKKGFNIKTKQHTIIFRSCGSKASPPSKIYLDFEPTDVFEVAKRVNDRFNLGKDRYDNAFNSGKFGFQVTITKKRF